MTCRRRGREEFSPLEGIVDCLIGAEEGSCCHVVQGRRCSCVHDPTPASSVLLNNRHSNGAKQSITFFAGSRQRTLGSTRKVDHPPSGLSNIQNRRGINAHTCFCRRVLTTSSGLLTHGPMPPLIPPRIMCCHDASSSLPKYKDSCVLKIW